MRSFKIKHFRFAKWRTKTFEIGLLKLFVMKFLENKIYAIFTIFSEFNDEHVALELTDAVH